VQTYQLYLKYEQLSTSQYDIIRYSVELVSITTRSTTLCCTPVLPHPGVLGVSVCSLPVTVAIEKIYDMKYDQCWRLLLQDYRYFSSVSIMTQNKDIDGREYNWSCCRGRIHSSRPQNDNQRLCMNLHWTPKIHAKKRTGDSKIGRMIALGRGNSKICVCGFLSNRQVQSHWARILQFKMHAYQHVSRSSGRITLHST
jgi:hypothetical protein